MISKYLQKKLVEHVLGRRGSTPPACLWVALFTTEPSDRRPLASELRGKGYARVESLGWKWWTARSRADSADDLTFPTATARWGMVTHVGLFDAQHGGHLLGWIALSEPLKIAAGDTIEFKAGDLSLAIE